MEMHLWQNEASAFWKHFPNKMEEKPKDSDF